MNRQLKITLLIAGGVFVLVGGSLLIYRAVKKRNRKRNTVFVEGSFKGSNCDELHAFQSTGGRIIGGMNDKVMAELKRLYDEGVNAEVTEVMVNMDADKMEVNWKVKIEPSKDGKAWVGFTSRGSAGSTAYDRADGKHVGQDFDSVLEKTRKLRSEPNAEMKLILDYLYNLNRDKKSLGKCPTRQLFYKYTMPDKFPHKK